MRISGEEPLILDQRRLNLGVLGKRRSVGDTQSLSCFAFGQQVIVDAVLAHDARRFLRDCAAQLLNAGCGPAHG